MRGFGVGGHVDEDGRLVFDGLSLVRFPPDPYCILTRPGESTKQAWVRFFCEDLRCIVSKNRREA